MKNILADIFGIKNVLPENYLLVRFNLGIKEVSEAYGFVTEEEAWKWVDLNVAKIKQDQYKVYRLTDRV